jgi:hypothetical protein
MTWQVLSLEPDVAVVVGGADSTVAELEGIASGLGRRGAVVIVVEPPGIGLGADDSGAGRRWWFSAPTVLAAEGDICDGALGLVAACDLTVMATEAQLVGTRAGNSTAGVLLEKLPQGEVLRMALLGRLSPLTATRAAVLGCVDEVIGLEEVRPRAVALARRAADKKGKTE